MAAIVPTQAMLDDARKQYHALVTGTSPRVVVDQNGERVEFTSANRQSLYNYIQQLQTALGGPCGSGTPDLSSYAPAGFLF